MKKTIFALLINSFLCSGALLAQSPCQTAFEQFTAAHAKDLSQWAGGQWCSDVQELIAQKGVRKSVSETEIRQFGKLDVTLEALLYDYTPSGGKPIYMDIYQQGGVVQFLQMPCPTSHSIEKVLPKPDYVLLSYDETYINKDGKKTRIANEECWLYPQRGIAYFRYIRSNDYVPSYIQVFEPCSMEDYFAKLAPSAFLVPGSSSPKMKK